MVLIILATISINAVFGENGIINRSEKTKLEYDVSKAREQLVLTLGNASIEKLVKKKYDLDAVILNEIQGSKISDNIVIIDGYAFEINRSIPEIGRYVGKESELVFPDVKVNVTLATDKKSSTIEITAKEEKNGINKIEIIQDEHVIKEYEYANKKEEFTEKFTAKLNGEYTIKVYGELTTTKKETVAGIVMSVSYSPNGNSTYKKEHEVTIDVEEIIAKVKKIKYQWLNTTEEPKEETFIEECKKGEKIKKDKVNGTWYLWILLETESGAKRIERSEGFNFDNEGPIVTLDSIPVSETSFTLTSTANDEHSDIVKYEFYVNGTKIERPEDEVVISTITKDMGAMAKDVQCVVNVYDSLGNKGTASNNDIRTKLHAWEKCTADITTKYRWAKEPFTYVYTKGETLITSAKASRLSEDTGLLSRDYQQTAFKVTDGCNAYYPYIFFNNEKPITDYENCFKVHNRCFYVKNFGSGNNPTYTGEMWYPEVYETYTNIVALNEWTYDISKEEKGEQFREGDNVYVYRGVK